MCTAVSYLSKDHYFGRNLDLEYSHNESVTVTPRNFCLPHRKCAAMSTHYAMIGIATVAENYPLYYDATNEHGLSMAGLNFPGNAVYQPEKAGCDNVTPFEFIPWILGQCKTVEEAIPFLKRTSLIKIDFNDQFPLSPLHWILADRNRAVTIEPLSDGLVIYENAVGVLTNNPPFDYHMHNLKNYLHLSSKEPENCFAPQIKLTPYSRGIGAYGLPGDLSSASRFIKAAYTKLNSVSNGSDSADISQFFHILGSVAQQNGCVQVDNGYEKTVYTSGCNTDKGIYYYTTYENQCISAVDLHRCNLDGDALCIYPLAKQLIINRQN